VDAKQPDKRQHHSNMGCGSSVPPALPASPPKHRADFDAVAPAPTPAPAAESTPEIATDVGPPLTPRASNRPASPEAGTGCTLRLICVNDVYEMDHMPRLKTAIKVGPARYCSLPHSGPFLNSGTRAIKALYVVAGNGPVRWCSPHHHRVPFISRNESQQCDL